MWVAEVWKWVVSLLTCPLLVTEKPGQCPPPRYMSGHYLEKCPQLCKGDSSCPGNKKCCPDSCYTFCKPPAKVSDIKWA
ncbi:hypothetical protein FKM82_026879 [Ascaphus truei]